MEKLMSREAAKTDHFQPRRTTAHVGRNAPFLASTVARSD